MDVVSPELNSLLPDEIMDTEAMEDMPHSQAHALSSGVTLAEETLITSTPKEPALCSSAENQVPLSISNKSTPLPTLKRSLATSTATTKTTDSVTGTTVSTGGMQKLSSPFTISAANHQIILNKVASAQAGEAAKSAATSHQVIKQEGQKLLVRTIGKSGQPIVLQLPPTGSKAAVGQTSGDLKTQTPQFKVVTIGGRTELKPLVGGTTNQMTTLQAQQLKTVQNIKPVQSVAVGGVGGSQFKTIIPLATQPNVQQIQVPGSRFHYVRLVTATTASSTVQPSGPSTNSVQTAKPMIVSAGAVRMSVPIVPAQSVKQVAPKPLTTTAQVVSTPQTQQRLIMPATPLPQIQPNFTNLPPGTVLAPAPGAGNVGYAVVPAQYVTQLQQTPFVTLASSSGFQASSSIQTQARLPLNGVSTTESTSRPRKPCNCTKSQCLKLYCDCFANGEFCNNCNCNNCFNNLEHETERLKAIKTCLDRNPEAFKPKIGKGKEGESDRRHSKGCNCKRSGCLKNYCECYEAKIMCSSICKCIGCKNFEESPERKTLMHLADAAEVRVQQQTAAKTKLSSQISDLLMRTTPVIPTGGGRLPYTFVTKEVLEATCECLLERAKRSEQTHQPQAEAERMILEEFGHCLMRIISSAGKAKVDCASINC
uniref:CRC domain-containing protein n=1 Tax=Periophthalmus magnuspinnatus TaxID=409849 RepID=A0A3B4AVL3_9GOBI